MAGSQVLLVVVAGAGFGVAIVPRLLVDVVLLVVVRVMVASVGVVVLSVVVEVLAVSRICSHSSTMAVSAVFAFRIRCFGVRAYVELVFEAAFLPHAADHTCSISFRFVC